MSDAIRLFPSHHLLALSGNFGEHPAKHYHQRSGCNAPTPTVRPRSAGCQAGAKGGGGAGLVLREGFRVPCQEFAEDDLGRSQHRDPVLLTLGRHSPQYGGVIGVRSHRPLDGLDLRNHLTV